MVIEPCAAQPGQRRPRLEVADIFRSASEAFRDKYAPTPEQRKVIVAIERCRTAKLGGHLDVCTTCGHETPAYNSCRNRTKTAVFIVTPAPFKQARAKIAAKNQHVQR
jgi:hypothetical protein